MVEANLVAGRDVSSLALGFELTIVHNSGVAFGLAGGGGRP